MDRKQLRIGGESAKELPCMPKPLEIRLDNQKPIFICEEESRGAGVVALDPGVRNFHTCYDPSGVVTEWRRSDMARIYRLCHAYDHLQSKWSQEGVRHKKRYRFKKAAMRTQFGIRNLIGDIHKKMVHWFCSNYRVVLLPSFETSQMLRKGQRRIHSKSARAMATWSHYRFQQRLLHKTREFPWCRVIICDEHYTSKTCGNCGFIHDKLAGSKTFQCPQCRYRHQWRKKHSDSRYLTLQLATFRSR
jgi:putative transposase